MLAEPIIAEADSGYPLIVHELHLPDVVIGLLEADGLISERFADVHLHVVYAHSPAAGDQEGLVEAWIGYIAEPFVLSRRSLIDLTWAFHSKGLVWTLAVVLSGECEELFLLLEQVRTWRFCSFKLKRLVHSLVPSVLLRITRFYSFDLNAQSYPPY